VDKINELLNTIQTNLYEKALKELENNMIVTKSFDEFKAKLDDKKIIQAPFCGEPSCEDIIKKESAREETEAGAPSMGAKSLCIPFKQPADIQPGDKCICPGCECQAKFYTLFGRSY